MNANEDMIFKTMRMGPIPAKSSALAKATLYLGILSVIPLLAPLLAIPVFLLGAIALYRISKGKAEGRKEALTGIAAAAIGLVLLAVLIAWPSGPKERIGRSICSSNLNALWPSLKQYALDNGGNFPKPDGARGLGDLSAKDYVNHDILCPAVKNQVIFGTISTPFTNYEYRGGLSLSTSPDEPLMWDKPGNHKGGGNVLFLDGHVEFRSQEWITEHVKAAKPNGEKGN